MIVLETPFQSRCFYYDIREDRCFSVSSDEMLTPEDIVNHGTSVEKADREEVESFVKYQIFKLDARRREEWTTLSTESGSGNGRSAADK